MIILKSWLTITGKVAFLFKHILNFLRYGLIWYEFVRSHGALEVFLILVYTLHFLLFNISKTKEN